MRCSDVWRRVSIRWKPYNGRVTRTGLALPYIILTRRNLHLPELFSFSPALRRPTIGLECLLPFCPAGTGRRILTTCYVCAFTPSRASKYHYRRTNTRSIPFIYLAEIVWAARIRRYQTHYIVGVLRATMRRFYSNRTRRTTYYTCIWCATTASSFFFLLPLFQRF